MPSGAIVDKAADILPPDDAVPVDQEDGGSGQASTFLAAIYDTLKGTRRAVEVARGIDSRGHQLQGIRLDSGDLLDLSLKTRALLDETELHGGKGVRQRRTRRFSGGPPTEGWGPIDRLGVGTKASVSADASWINCAYKMVEYDGRLMLELSTGKKTLPDPKQVYCF